MKIRPRHEPQHSTKKRTNFSLGRRSSVSTALRETKFKPRLSRWHPLLTAFQLPIGPMRDTTHLGETPGRIVEHTTGGDFPAFFCSGAPSSALKKVRTKLKELEAELNQVKAANELLRRLRDESEKPNLKLLRALRSPGAENIIRILARDVRSSVASLIDSDKAMYVLSELSQAELVTIQAGIIVLTDKGKHLVKETLSI